MFERLGSITYRFRFLVVAAWIAGAAAAAMFAPSLATQGQTDQTGFLPSTSVSVQARTALERSFPGGTAASTASLTFTRAGGLTAADRAFIGATAAWIVGPDAPSILRDAVTSVDTADSRPELASILRSTDGQLEMATVNLNVPTAGDASGAAVAALREHLAAASPAGLATHVTGTAAISADYLAAIIRGTDSTTAVTVLLVIVILLLIYRAPLAAFVPLATIGAAFLVARGVLGVLAAAGWKVSSLLDTFIVVLVFGVGTDYTIFLISRFREEVARGSWHEASMATVHRIGRVIVASAATVIVGLGSMAFADFGMIQTTGPALAVAIAVTLVAGLTLAPALLAIFGHYLFWPLHARLDAGGEAAGLFARLAAGVSRRPGLVTVVLLVALIAPATAVNGMHTNFDVLSELPADSDARAGFDDVSDHLGKGRIVQSTAIVDAGADQNLLTPASLARLRDLAAELVATPGVAGVTTLVSPDGDGVVPDGFQPSKQLATMADGLRGSGGGTTAGESGADTQALLDPSVTDGLASAGDYLAGLAVAFPEIGGGTQLRAATGDLALAMDQVEQARKGALVSNQLRSLATALRSPTTAMAGIGDGSTASSSVIGDYLDELVAAYPEVRGLAAYDRAVQDAAGLAHEATISTALDLATRLETLASRFDDRSEATLFPASLAGTPESLAFRREISTTFDRLPNELDTLAGLFSVRRDDIYLPTGLTGEAGHDLERAVDAFVSADRTSVRMYLTTSDDPYAPAAFRTIRDVQAVLAAAAPGFGPSATALLGGPTAEFADVQDVLSSDFGRVGVITVLGILAVLVLLLRAVVAPLYLVATVLLSCATAIGLSSWFFQDVLGQPGVSFYLPLLVFVLLVALGSDYNIFLMSRVREESEQRPIHEGIRVASGRTGAVITSAGLILAGTFGSMASAPLVVLFQVGVAVAVGVLIDTFLVRSILVPAITTLVGDRAWWPSGAGIGAALRGWSGVLAPGFAAEAADAARGASTRRRLVVLGMIALVPMAFAFLFTWSLGGASGRLDGVRAAVVDQDTGTTFTTPDGTVQALTLGADLRSALLAGDAGDGLTWTASEPVTAEDGLADGRYDVVLTIPANFSSTIAAIRADAGGQASKATLRVETGDASGYAVGPAAASIARAIADTTSRGVVASYVDDVLVRVGAAHGDLATAAGLAGGLVTGSTSVQDGAAGVSAVAGELVSGLEQLAAGATDAGDGSRQLAGALRTMAAGAEGLADGATDLAGGARAEAKGAKQVADGAAALSRGLGSLSSSITDLPTQAGALAAGSSGVADGAADLGAGARTLADSMAVMRAGTKGLGDQVAGLHAGAADVAGGAGDLAAGSARAAGVASDLAAGASSMADTVTTYTAGVRDLAAGCAALGGSDPLCAQLQALADSGAPVAGAADGVASGLAELRHSLGGLADGASETQRRRAGGRHGDGVARGDRARSRIRHRPGRSRRQRPRGWRRVADRRRSTDGRWSLRPRPGHAGPRGGRAGFRHRCRKARRRDGGHRRRRIPARLGSRVARLGSPHGSERDQGARLRRCSRRRRCGPADGRARPGPGRGAPHRGRRRVGRHGRQRPRR